MRVRILQFEIYDISEWLMKKLLCSVATGNKKEANERGSVVGVSLSPATPLKRPLFETQTCKGQWVTGASYIVFSFVEQLRHG